MLHQEADWREPVIAHGRLVVRMRLLNWNVIRGSE